ncbi:MAG TPA: ABC transporter permease [Kofleriaceae bacterium]|jgi:lipoprotein-releasing system permease protein
MRYELFIGWRYLYGGKRDRAMLWATGASVLVLLVGVLLLATSHGANAVGVGFLVGGMLGAAICGLLSVFSVFTSVSTFGVVLGVAALTVVLSVTTGFQQQFRDKVLGVNAHVIILKSQSTNFTEYRDVMKTAKNIDSDVVAVQPFIFTEMLAIAQSGKPCGVGVKGVDPVLVRQVLDLERYMIAGSIDALGEPKDADGLAKVIIGEELAHKLRVKVGDKMTIVAPTQVSGDPSKGPSTPRSEHFRVAGIFYSGFEEYDQRLIYAALKDVQEIEGNGDVAMGVELKLDDVDRAPAIARKLEKVLQVPYQVQDWYELNHNLFTALNLQKLVLTIILTLIIIVATVNMVSALTMMVTDKTREVGILKSMGSTSADVARMFQVVGLSIGGVGTIIGLTIGLVTCYVVGRYGYHLDPKVYLIDRLPIETRPFEVALVAIVTMIISVVATLVPSSSASSLRPAEGLRYD